MTDARPAIDVSPAVLVGLPSDPLVAALARYVEALHRRYPDGPDQLRREALDGRATITRMPTRNGKRAA